MKVPSYEGNEPYVFISYAHKDSVQVLKVLSYISERGLRIWYDDGIAPGSEWPEYIATHLDRAAAVISFITENSVNSPNCRREITFALSRNKPFVSVYLEKTEIPLGLELQISAQQSVLRYNYSSEEDFLSKLYSTPAFEPCLERRQPEPAAGSGSALAGGPEAGTEEQAGSVEEKKTGPMEPDPADRSVRPERSAEGTAPHADRKAEETDRGKKDRGRQKKDPDRRREKDAAGSGKSAPADHPGHVSGGKKKKTGLIIGAVAAAAVICAAAVLIPNLTAPKSYTAVSDPDSLGDLRGVGTSLILDDKNMTADMVAKVSRLKKLTSLTFRDCTFSEGALDGLTLKGEGRKNLRFYNASGIDDISFVTQQDDYSEVAFENCQLTDEVVPDLSAVTIRLLDLSDNPDLTTVSLNSAEMTALDLSGTGISDIGFLSEAASLNSLKLKGCAVSDIQPVAALTRLQTIDLSGTQISEFPPQLDSLGLSKLYLNGCGLTSLEGMTDYVELKEVDLGGNALKDVSFLEGVAGNLTALDLSGNDITGDSLGWLSRAEKMQVLRLDHVDMGSLQLSFLAGMPDLTELSARDCSITDVSGMEACKALGRISLGFNEISDISPIGKAAADRTVLTLDLAGNQVENLSALKGKYQELILIGNPVSSLVNQDLTYIHILLVDYFEGIENSSLKNAVIGTASVTGCPRDKQQALSKAVSSVRYQTREEQLELLRTEAQYTDYEGWEDRFLAIEEPEGT